MRTTTAHNLLGVAVVLLLGVPNVARAASADLATAAAARESCLRNDVLCLDRDGLGYAGDVLPAQLPAGAALSVKVLGCASENQGHTFKLEQAVVLTADRLFKDETTQALAPEAAAAEPCSVDVLAQGRFTVPTSVAAQRFTLGFTRVRSASGDKPEAVERTETHVAAITHGRYYLDVAVLIPVVLGGKREVVADDTDQDDVKRLRVRDDVGVFPALMLHVFPGGREFGALSSFSRSPECRAGRLDAQRCRAARHRRRAANSLGLQAGIELDFKKFNRFYLGGLFEPVAGFSINAGVALTRQQYVRGGYYEGALIPTPTVVQADGTPDLSRYIDQRWVPRFYVGISLSLDIIRYLGERRRSNELGSILPQ